MSVARLSMVESVPYAEILLNAGALNKSWQKPASLGKEPEALARVICPSLMLSAIKWRWPSSFARA